jgi:TolA-binding protein
MSVAHEGTLQRYTMTRYRFMLVGALLIAAAAPAAAQNREHQQIAAENRMMQEQLQQLAISMANLSRALTESIAALNARLDEAAESTRRGFADQKLLVDNLSNDVRVVRAGSEDTNVRIRALSEELEALRATVLALQAAAAANQTLAAPLDPNAPPADPTAPVVPLPAPPAPTPSTAGLSPTRMFEEARGDYFLGRFAAAIAGFEGFLRAFPGSGFADEAYFLIGESHFAQNAWPEAIAAYNQVIQNYAGTNSVPDAYYKRGLAQERSGQIDAARASWDALIKSAPDSTAAQLARQGLDRVGRAQRQ